MGVGAAAVSMLLLAAPLLPYLLSSSPPFEQLVPPCPSGTSWLADFEAESARWTACEDLSSRAGGITLLSNLSETVHLPKSHEPIQTSDAGYYLGLEKADVLHSSKDLLGEKLLGSSGGLSWAAVEKALPPIRGNSYGPWGKATNGCVRTFVGSRSAAYVSSFSDGECSNGRPQPRSSDADRRCEQMASRAATLHPASTERSTGPTPRSRSTAPGSLRASSAATCPS